ncbi:hypothetical protein WJX81_006484 [Elliptochloris bilobata]|uniref:Hypervirulence associated protein TUDOR domain-containing protein n=1 Tax=Elliptochloris bilobata TaxID=381761 RepID=A0AAW1QY16_9CHLO
MTDPTEMAPGDTVEWKWGASKHITGQVVDKQDEGKAVIESKGKEITRNATPDNPAYTIHGARNPVLKKGSELEKVASAEDDEEEEEEEPEADGEDEEADEGLADDAAAPATGRPRTRLQAKKAAS